MKYLLFISGLLILISKPVTADPLESQNNLRTLFTSTHMRNQLDKLREQGKFENTQKNATSTIFREPVTLKMQGIVIRDNKKPVVFVNDGNTLKSHRVNDEIIVNTRKVNKSGYKVPVRVNQQSVKLKPGQQWNETDRHVQDNYQIKPSKVRTSVSDGIMKEVNNLTVKTP